MYSDVPLSAPYFRQCVLQFETLYLKQNTAVPTTAVNGESVFFDNRFTVPVSDEAAEKCSKYLGLKRIYNLLDQDSGDLIDDADMRLRAFDLAPDKIKNTPEVHEWVDEVMEAWTVIKNSIPPGIVTAANYPISTQQFQCLKVNHCWSERLGRCFCRELEGAALSAARRWSISWRYVAGKGYLAFGRTPLSSPRPAKVMC